MSPLASGQALTLAVISLVGLVAFLYPLFLSGRARLRDDVATLTPTTRRLSSGWCWR